jgi:hypothetical protein
MKGRRGQSLSTAGSDPSSAPNQLSTSGPLSLSVSICDGEVGRGQLTAHDGSPRPSLEARSRWNSTRDSPCRLRLWLARPRQQRPRRCFPITDDRMPILKEQAYAKLSSMHCSTSRVLLTCGYGVNCVGAGRAWVLRVAQNYE